MEEGREGRKEGRTQGGGRRKERVMKMHGTSIYNTIA
jgi:hypothetical protein